MKKNFSALCLILVVTFLHSCKPQKKFTATNEEKASYNLAYSYAKNIRTVLTEKEIEPGVKEMFIEAADNVSSYGDIEEVEKKINHSDFLAVQNKISDFVKSIKPNEKVYTQAEWNNAEKEYKKIQKKLIALKPNFLRDGLANSGNEINAINSFLFMTEQIKKYDLKTYLNKTFAKFEELPIFYKQIEDLIASSELNNQLEDLQKIIDKPNNRELISK